MKKNNQNIIIQFKRLLDITEKEQLEIEKNNIDKLEEYGLMKKNIVNAIEKMKKDGSWNAQDEENTEVESILKKIEAVNSSNSIAVKTMLDKINDQIRDQKYRSTAINAYNKFA